MTDSSPNILNYHHQDDEHFSLRYLTDQKARFKSEYGSYRDDEKVTVRKSSEVVDEEEIFLIYGNNAPKDALPGFDSENELVQWIRERFDRDDLQIVLAVFRAYRGILEEKANAGNRLRLYKMMELERIPEIINRVEWGQSVPDVGANLLSEFILVHPMPNTNHRTGISLLDRYLSSFDTGFSMPQTGEEGEWYDWVEDFILNSKRLLTLRRRHNLFRYADEFGYDKVRRKEDIVIDLDSINFDRDDLFDYYGELHYKHTREFVERLLTITNSDSLRDRIDDGKSVFVNRLRENQ